MNRLLIALIFVFFSSHVLAKGTGRAPAEIYYYPYIHADPLGKNYESRGGDQTFFSYLHVALEILKAPKDYEVFMEGYYFNLYPGSRYRLSPREVRKVRRVFRGGFPRHITSWTRKQKEYLVKYGPITVLYMIKKIRRVRSADRWISKRKMIRQLKRCASSKYMEAFSKVNFNKLHMTWGEFYSSLRDARKGISGKSCYRILSFREKYVVRQMKRRAKRSKKKLLLIYGYAHDFGRYFKDNINYLGSPVLQYAASCYKLRNKKVVENIRYFCSHNFEHWLQKLGHANYFDKGLPDSLLRQKAPPQIAKYYTNRDTQRLAQSYYKRGKYYEKSGQYRKAVSDFQKAVQLNPQDSQVYNDLGWGYFILKKYKQALSNLRRSIELTPGEAQAYNRLGLVYADRKDLTNAVGMFHKAIQANPRYASAYNNLAWTYYEKGKAQEGLPFVEKALELDGDNGVILDTRAHIYEAMGKYKEAHRDFQKALKYIPNSPITREGLKRVQAKL